MKKIIYAVISLSLAFSALSAFADTTPTPTPTPKTKQEINRNAKDAKEKLKEEKRAAQEKLKAEKEKLKAGPPLRPPTLSPSLNQRLFLRTIRFFRFFPRIYVFIL